MGVFKRLTTGLQLARGSMSVLRDHPKLLAFPFIGGIAGIVYILTLLGGAFGLVQPENEVAVYGVLFFVYLGSTFIASFSTAALMHASRQTFHGTEPSIRESLRAAWSNAGTLFAWAFISAVVSLIIRAIEESSDIGGKIIAVVFSVAWAVITYFVLPVIVFEDVSIRDAFSRSGSLVKDIWGESLGAEAGVSIVSFLLTLCGVAIAALLYFALPIGSFAGLLVVAVLGGGAIVLALLVGYALTGIAKTALYVYGTEDETPRYFEHVKFGK